MFFWHNELLFYRCYLVHAIVVISSTLLCVVMSNVEQWFDMNMTGQDLRVSHCEMSTLEHYMQHLCDATHRDYSHHLFRSKHALASKIVEIFRWSLRGILGKLTQRAHPLRNPTPVHHIVPALAASQVPSPSSRRQGSEVPANRSQWIAQCETVIAIEAWPRSPLKLCSV